MPVLHGALFKETQHNNCTASGGTNTCHYYELLLLLKTDILALRANLQNRWMPGANAYRTSWHDHFPPPYLNFKKCHNSQLTSVRASQQMALHNDLNIVQPNGSLVRHVLQVKWVWEQIGKSIGRFWKRAVYISGSQRGPCCSLLCNMYFIWILNVRYIF